MGFAALFAVFVPGCDFIEKMKKKAEESQKAKVGDACTVDVAACADDEEILYCVKGKFAAFPCKGKKGCYERTNSGSTEIFCDMSGNEVGDKCWASQVVEETKKVIKRAGGQEGKGGCSADTKAMVVCEGGKIAHTQCRGPKGCTQSGTDLHCDMSVAREGDPCEGNGASCSEDGKQFLMCKDGKSTVDRQCRGEPCKVEGTKVSCDGSVAEVGDPCEGEGAACSVDKKAFLVCQGNKFVEKRKCSACTIEGDNVRCK